MPLLKCLCQMIVLGVLLAGAAHAQTAALEGVVRDAETEEPLPQAHVVLEGTIIGVATDAEGFFEIEGVPPGAHVVLVTYLGYDTFRQEITLAEGERKRMDIALTPEQVEAGELVVEAQRGLTGRELGAARMTPAEVKQLPTVLEPDVFRALQLLPGIQAASDFSSGLYIRGGSPDQTLVLLDRTTIYNPSHVFGFFSSFNPDAIRDVEVYKGGYPARYGGRLGSVVDIESRRGSQTRTQGQLSLGLLASRVSAEGPFEGGSWMVAARRSTLEPLLALLNSADVEGVPRSFHFYDLNGRLYYEPGDHDRLALSVYAGRDRLDYPFLDDAQFDVRYGNRTMSGRWTHLFSDRLVSDLYLTASRYDSLPTALIGGTELEQTNRVGDYSLEGDLTYDYDSQHTLSAGFESGLFRFALRNSFDGEERFRPRVQSPYAAAYVQDSFTPAERWEVTGGLRVNYYGNGDHFRLNPRLSVQHELTDDLRLQAGYGRYTQFLTLVTSELFSAFDVWLTASDGVSPAYGDQFVFGLKADLPYALSLDVEGYYRTMQSLFELDPLLPDVTGVDYTDVFHFGDGHAQGLEVFLERTQGRLTGFLSYDLSRTMRRFEGFEGSQYFPPKYDRRHDLNLALQYALSSSWRATGVFAFASGQAYTEPSAQYRIINSPFSNQTNTVFQSEFNAARLPSYHRLDLGVQREGAFFGLADYELQLQLVNVYGRRNVWFYLFDAESDGTVNRTEVPQIPVPLPDVALTLHF